MIADGQLSLFEGNGHSGGDDDLLAAVRKLVAEPDMTAAEVEAVVADALAEMGWHPEVPLRAQPCRCVRRLIFRPGSTCHWCGHSPHAEGGPRYVEPVERRQGGRPAASRSRRCRRCRGFLVWSGRAWTCEQVTCPLFERPQEEAAMA